MVLPYCSPGHAKGSLPSCVMWGKWFNCSALSFPMGKMEINIAPLHRIGAAQSMENCAWHMVSSAEMPAAVIIINNRGAQETELSLENQASWLGSWVFSILTAPPPPLPAHTPDLEVCSWQRPRASGS